MWGDQLPYIDVWPSACKSHKRVSDRTCIQQVECCNCTGSEADINGVRHHRWYVKEYYLFVRVSDGWDLSYPNAWTGYPVSNSKHLEWYDLGIACDATRNNNTHATFDRCVTNLLISVTDFAPMSLMTYSSTDEIWTERWIWKSIDSVRFLQLCVSIIWMKEVYNCC